MISYKDALKLYNRIAKPPRSAYWRYEAQDNAKPLKSVGERHKSIHMMDNGVIYFKLYDTHVATFLPNEDNTYTVVLRYYSTPTTNKFMSDFGLHYAYQQTDRGYHAYIPYLHAPYTVFASAVLTYDAETNDLITDPTRSWHPVISTRVSSQDDKQERANVRAKLKPILMLAAYSVDAHRDFAQTEAHQAYAKPFFSIDWHGSPNSPLADMRNLRSFVTQKCCAGEWADNPSAIFESDEFIQKFLGAVPAFLTLHISKQAAVEYDNRWSKDDGRPSWDSCVEHALNNIDATKFGKSLERYMLSWLRLSEGSDKKPVPMFARKLPNKWRFYDHECPESFLNKLSARVRGLK